MAARRAPPLFVDTSAWVALLHARDESHAVAARIWPTVRAGHRRLVTTNLVLAEAHPLLARRLGIAAGRQFLDRTAQHPHQRTIWADQELTEAAVQRWLRKFPTATFSLTDVVSFEVMRREGIKEAFAFDHHFRVAGFGLVTPPRTKP